MQASCRQSPGSFKTIRQDLKEGLHSGKVPGPGSGPKPHRLELSGHPQVIRFGENDTHQPNSTEVQGQTGLLFGP